MPQPIGRALVLILASGLGLWPGGADAHDASAWGGLFRTRDGGTSWFQASTGRVMGGALAVSVNPARSDQLLLGTDSGLLRSDNGGRDWDLVAPDLLAGPVLGVAFDALGEHALASTAATLAAFETDGRWQTRSMPLGASPPRALVPDGNTGGFYLLGWNGLLRTNDAGTNWSSVWTNAPGATTSLVASGEDLVAVSGGEVWRSPDRGTTWQRSRGLPAGQVDALAFDLAMTYWAGAANQLFRSTDAGESWSPVGHGLPESGTHIHAVWALQGRLLVSTDRGLYLSRDAGITWDVLADNLPGHIEAGPLIADPLEPATLYVGFSVTPYSEIWQNAASGTSALARISASEVAGAVAFLALLGVCAGALLHVLARRSVRPSSSNAV